MSDFYIQRVQIEGGFLDGFDLNLKNGLNTIIGARGTGKSTLMYAMTKIFEGYSFQTADNKRLFGSFIIIIIP